MVRFYLSVSDSADRVETQIAPFFAASPKRSTACWPFSTLMDLIWLGERACTAVASAAFPSMMTRALDVWESNRMVGIFMSEA